MGLFPRGVVLDTAEKFNRFHLLVHIAGKLSRYCQQFDHGHEDSLVDAAGTFTLLCRGCRATPRQEPPDLQKGKNDHDR